jgi:membrane protein implicated in regulation of membrane protease activity
MAASSRLPDSSQSKPVSMWHDEQAPVTTTKEVIAAAALAGLGILGCVGRFAWLLFALRTSERSIHSLPAELMMFSGWWIDLLLVVYAVVPTVAVWQGRRAVYREPDPHRAQLLGRQWRLPFTLWLGLVMLLCFIAFRPLVTAILGESLLALVVYLVIACTAAWTLTQTLGPPEKQADLPLFQGPSLACPHCGRRYSLRSPWTCLHCEHENADTSVHGFLNACGHCKVRPRTLRCGECHTAFVPGEVFRKPSDASTGRRADALLHWQTSHDKSRIHETKHSQLIKRLTRETDEAGSYEKQAKARAEQLKAEYEVQAVNARVEKLKNQVQETRREPASKKERLKAEIRKKLGRSGDIQTAVAELGQEIEDGEMSQEDKQLQTETLEIIAEELLDENAGK